MQALADHRAPMENEHSNNRMELKRRALKPKPHRDLLQRPALVNPIRHNLHNKQAHRNRGAFKVLALARRILGHHGNRDVEARKTGEAAEHEEAEQDMINGCAETQAESGSGRGNAEGDEVGERIEFLTHERGLAPPACDFAVHEVEEEAEGDEGEREVEVGVVEGVGLRAVAERGEDGHYAAEAWTVKLLASNLQYASFSHCSIPLRKIICVYRNVGTYH
jgi:hypothetical protein